jgi:hypothetical protein
MQSFRIFDAYTFSLSACLLVDQSSHIETSPSHSNSVS